MSEIEEMFWQTAITILIFAYSFPLYNLHVVFVIKSNCFIDVCVKLVLNGLATRVDYYYRFTIDSQIRKESKLGLSVTLVLITHDKLSLSLFETKKCFCVLLKLLLNTIQKFVYFER